MMKSIFSRNRLLQTILFFGFGFSSMSTEAVVLRSPTLNSYYSNQDQIGYLQTLSRQNRAGAIIFVRQILAAPEYISGCFNALVFLKSNPTVAISLSTDIHNLMLYLLAIPHQVERNTLLVAATDVYIQTSTVASITVIQLKSDFRNERDPFVLSTIQQLMNQKFPNQNFTLP